MGRPRKYNHDQIVSALRHGISAKSISAAIGCSEFNVRIIAEKSKIPIQRDRAQIETGEQLNAMRIERDMSIAELAMQFGIGVKMLEMWLYGKRGIPKPYRRIVYLAMKSIPKQAQETSGNDTESESENEDENSNCGSDADPGL